MKMMGRGRDTPPWAPHPQKNSNPKIRPGGKAFQASVSELLMGPLVTPCPAPYRGFLAPGMTSSPVTGAFIFLAWVVPLYLELYIEIIAYPWDKGFIF
jgi:hypothetical protein